MKRLACVLLVCAALLLGASPQPGRATPTPARAAAGSQSSSTLITFEGGLGGTITDGFVEGSTAYLIEGDYLTVLDISDAAAPRLRSRTPLPEDAWKLVAANGFVYLLCSGAQSLILIYDARNPAAPQLAGQLALPEYVYPYRMTIASGALWLVNPDAVRRYDLSDPAAPTLANTFVCNRCSVQTSGALAYFFETTTALQIWDLSNPQAPLLRALITKLYPDPGEGSGLALDGNRLYAAVRQKAIITLDVSDPTAPAVLATGAANVEELGVAGNLIATLTSNYRLQVYSIADPARPALLFEQLLLANSFQVLGTRFYAASGDAWSIFDLSGAGSAGVLRGRVSQALSAIKTFTPAGQRLYAHLPNAVQIIDTSDPRSPVLQARIPRDPSQLPDIDGARLLIPGEDGLRLIDASAPLSPTVRAVLPEGRTGQLNGDLAYVITGAGLEILDISDMAAPVPLGSTTFPTDTLSPYELVVADGRAYIGLVSMGNCSPPCRFREYFLAVQVVDVSNPQQPRAAGRINNLSLGTRMYVGPDPSSWAVKGTTLFVANTILHVIDVSNIDSPTLSDYRYNNTARDLQIAGDRAYVAGDPGLTVLDLADPLHPTTMGRFDTVTASQVRVVGERAYLLARTYASTDGLHVLDISNPAAPVQQAVYRSRATSIAVAEPYVYLVLGDGGFQILRIRDMRVQQLLPLVRKR
ncbi:MAG TPA: hypothetical protein VFS21_16770 [Roseiflexaceae bacterium]|nr:hypothetical protein [Roseiflexaceae bacterium]